MSAQLTLMDDAYDHQFKDWDQRIQTNALFPVAGNATLMAPTTAAPGTSSSQGPTGPI